MRETRLIMGMPITVEIVGAPAQHSLEAVFGYFDDVDRRFSTYKPESEISAINEGRMLPDQFSAEMVEVLSIAEMTRQDTDGFFDINRPEGGVDPSGIVKGWAIRNAARLLAGAGIVDFFIDAGGDVQSSGRNAEGKPWRIGIRNPFDQTQIVKVLCPKGRGVATSGSYVRGQHIYDPHLPGQPLDEVVSLTVIGPDVLEADRFATGAFAMGRDGIAFVESWPGLEGYQIDQAGKATYTSGFAEFVSQ